jgi:hypothetical protein
MSQHFLAFTLPASTQTQSECCANQLHLISHLQATENAASNQLATHDSLDAYGENLGDVSNSFTALHHISLLGIDHVFRAINVWLIASRTSGVRLGRSLKGS